MQPPWKKILQKKAGEPAYEESLKAQRPITRIDKPIAKFKIFDFINKSKSSERPALKGIYHHKGTEVATNAFVLVAVKTDYDKKLEGKITDKEGKEINGHYPEWEQIGAGEKGS